MQIKTSELALQTLHQLQRSWDIAKSIPKTPKWNTKDTQRGKDLRAISNLKYRQREDTELIIDKSEDAIYNILNKAYKNALATALELSPTDPITDEEGLKDWTEFKNQVAALPLDLPKEPHDLNTDAIDGMSLWSYIEDMDNSFDLGDDGTDEAEQELAILAFLAQLPNDWRKLSHTNPLPYNIWHMADIWIRTELTSDIHADFNLDIHDYATLLWQIHTKGDYMPLSIQIYLEYYLIRDCLQGYLVSNKFRK